MLSRLNSRLSREEIFVKGNVLKEKVFDLILEGTARHILIVKEDRTLLDIPLMLGIGSTAAAILLHAPLTAILAITALTADIKIVIYKEERPIN